MAKKERRKRGWGVWSYYKYVHRTQGRHTKRSKGRYDDNILSNRQQQ